jgi:FkbM family methyltransferase
MASAYFPDAAFHCFEIVGETAATLRERIGDLPGVSVNAFGLSNAAGEVRLKRFPAYNTLASMVEVEHAFDSIEDTGSVQRGDDYCAQRHIDHIDFLKIDVEAAEWMVLQGFSAMAAAGRIDAIQFEYGTGSIVTKFMLKDYYQMLGSQGYVLGKIYPDYVEFRDYHTRHEDFTGPNFLAVHASRRELLRLLA